MFNHKVATFIFCKHGIMRLGKYSSTQYRQLSLNRVWFGFLRTVTVIFCRGALNRPWSTFKSESYTRKTSIPESGFEPSTLGLVASDLTTRQAGGQPEPGIELEIG